MRIDGDVSECLFAVGQFSATIDQKKRVNGEAIYLTPHRRHHKISCIIAIVDESVKMARKKSWFQQSAIVSFHIIN